MIRRGEQAANIALGLLFSFGFLEIPLFSLGSIRITSVELLIAFAFGIGIVFFANQLFKISRITIGMFAVLASMLITTICIPDSRLAAFKFFIRFGVGIALYQVLLSFFRTGNSRLIALRALIYGSIIFSLIGIMQHYFPDTFEPLLSLLVPNKFAVFDPSSSLSLTTGVFQNGERLVVRASSVFGYCNTFSYYLAIVIGAAFLLFQMESDRYGKQVAVIAIAMSIWALWLTYSRGAWLAVSLAFFVGVIGWFVKSEATKKRRLLLASMLIAVVFVVAFIALSFRRTIELPTSVLPQDGLWSGYQTSTDNYDSISTRIQLWQAAIALWKTSPWVGIGVDRFRFRYYDMLDDANFDLYAGQGLYQPHNIFLTALTGQGLLGLLALFVCVLSIASQIYCKRREFGNSQFVAIFAMLAVVATANLYDAMLFDSYTHMLLITMVLALLSSWGEDE